MDIDLDLRLEREAVRELCRDGVLTSAEAERVLSQLG